MRRIDLPDLLLIVLAALLVLVYVAAGGGGFPLDDSWIHQTYARNFAQTGQFAFVPGEPSAASTSPLYTLLLAAGYGLRVPFAVWTHALGIAALAAGGMVARRMAQAVAPDVSGVGLVAGLALIGTWHLVWAAASGMETMLFSTFTLVLLWLAWREFDRDGQPPLVRGAVFGVCAALAMLARPEGVLLAALVGLALLVVQPHGGRVALVWSAGAALAFAVAIAPYLAYNLTYTGGLLPDTAAAKQAENAPLLALPFLARVVNLLYPLTAGIQLLLVPAAVVYAAVVVRRARADRAHLLYLLPLVWSAALILLYAARLPAPYQHGRYVIPALPAFLVAGVVGMAWWLRLVRLIPLQRILVRSLALAAAVAGVYFVLVVGTDAYRRDVGIINEAMVAASLWIRDNLAPDDLLAVHDIGAVGYFAPRPLLDLAGLVSPQIVPFILDADALWAWMEGRGAVYLMAFPDQIPNENPADPRLCLLFTADGAMLQSVGQPGMAVYRLAWDRRCPPL